MSRSNLRDVIVLEKHCIRIVNLISFFYVCAEITPENLQTVYEKAANAYTGLLARLQPSNFAKLIFVRYRNLANCQ